MKTLNRKSVLAISFAVAAACSGTGEGADSAADDQASAAERVTLRYSADGCFLDGSGRSAPGRMELALENQTGDEVRVDVWSLPPDHTFAEFSKHVDGERARLEAGDEPIGPPSYADLVTFVTADPGTTGVEGVTLAEGVHAFACFPWEGDAPTMHAAGPLEVSSGAEDPDGNGAVDLALPRARAYSLMADAPGDGVLLYGGQWGLPPGIGLSDIWAFDPADGWTQLDPGPENVHGGDGFLLETDSSQVVIVEAERTRILDPGTGGIRPLKTNLHPSDIWGTRFAYDSQSDVVIGFGGLDPPDVTDETWALDVETRTWRRMDPRPHPPADNFFAMAYDPGTDRVILLNHHGETWGYDVETNTWTNLRPERTPPERTYASMVYDAVGKRIVLFGGVTYDLEEPFGDTWAYDADANRWTEIETSSAPSPRGWHAMTTDLETGLIYLFSGGERRETEVADLWAFDPVTDEWRQVE